jgi:hypothetical protein
MCVAYPKLPSPPLRFVRLDIELIRWSCLTEMPHCVDLLGHKQDWLNFVVS